MQVTICWGLIPPPKQGEDFSRPNPQLTAQHGGHTTCTTTGDCWYPRAEQKAIQGMTNLLQWEGGSLLEAYSTRPLPVFSLKHDPLVSARKEVGTWQEAGLSCPLPISLVHLTLFPGKPKQGSSIHLVSLNKISTDFQPWAFLPQIKPLQLERSLKISWKKENLAV